MIRYVILFALLVSSPAVGGLVLAVAHDGVHGRHGQRDGRSAVGVARISEPDVLLSVAPDVRLVSTRPTLSTEIVWADWGPRGSALAATAEVRLTAPRPTMRPDVALSVAAISPKSVKLRDARAPASRPQAVSALSTQSPQTAESSLRMLSQPVVTASAMDRAPTPAPRYLIGVYR